jgi:hypothetical protein
MKTRKYYSSRTNKEPLTVSGLYHKLQHVYLYFAKRDYFKEKAGIIGTMIPDEFIHKAGFSLRFQPFPITNWAPNDITEDNIFDVIEFLYDHVSEPGELGNLTDDTGFNYTDYLDYDEESGKKEFRQKINMVLADYRDGYELSEDGEILAIGRDGLKQIINAEILPYDEENVDSKVREAIRKWRNRHLDISERREAIVEMAGVFEWLKKTGKLNGVLSRRDEGAIFNIANNFALRHHNPEQKNEYDKDIWYPWMFHFYLATYHAVIRLIKRKEAE